MNFIHPVYARRCSKTSRVAPDVFDLASPRYTLLVESSRVASTPQVDIQTIEIQKCAATYFTTEASLHHIEKICIGEK
jgi:hypothetical protein